MDVFVVGEVAPSKLSPAFRKAQERLERDVNATVYSRKEFLAKVAEGNHFVRSVLKGEKLLVLGTARELQEANHEERE